MKTNIRSLSFLANRVTSRSATTDNLNNNFIKSDITTMLVKNQALGARVMTKETIDKMITYFEAASQKIQDQTVATNVYEILDSISENVGFKIQLKQIQRSDSDDSVSMGEITAGLSKKLSAIEQAPEKLQEANEIIAKEGSNVATLLTQVKDLHQALSTLNIQGEGNLELKELLEEVMKATEPPQTDMPPAISSAPYTNRRRASTVLANDLKPFYYGFSAYEEGKQSFYKLAQKTNEVVTTLSNIAEKCKELDTLKTELQNSDNTLGTQVATAESMQKVRLDLATSLQALAKLRLHNHNAKPLSDQVQCQCLEVFNKKVKEALTLYVAKQIEIMGDLTQALSVIVSGISRGEASQEKCTRMQKVIESLRADYARLSANQASVEQRIVSSQGTLENLQRKLTNLSRCSVTREQRVHSENYTD